MKNNKWNLKHFKCNNKTLILIKIRNLKKKFNKIINHRYEFYKKIPVQITKLFLKNKQNLKFQNSPI